MSRHLTNFVRVLLNHDSEYTLLLNQKLVCSDLLNLRPVSCTVVQGTYHDDITVGNPLHIAHVLQQLLAFPCCQIVQVQLALVITEEEV